VLADYAVGYDAAIPRTAEGLQPLHAVWAPSALPAIEAHLRARQWNLHSLLPKLRVKIVGPSALERVDPSGLSCFNLNTPADYQRARVLRDPSTR
jgi:molybdopterin-guanine dinucleotide biosynthesis protein A